MKEFLIDSYPNNVEWDYLQDSLHIKQTSSMENNESRKSFYYVPINVSDKLRPIYYRTNILCHQVTLLLIHRRRKKKKYSCWF